MTVNELYAKLTSKAFQDAANGDMFYNFFIFQYDAKKEYQMRGQILEFRRNLTRPTAYVDVLTLDLFDEFCKFLDAEPFGKQHPSMKRFLLDMEKTDAAGVAKMLVMQANGRKFYEYIHRRIIEHISQDDGYKRPYVFIYGIGDIFPYLRVNTFLTNYEKYNQSNKYKLIVFYPGKCVGNSFSLFGVFDDAHTYRATLLLN
ncbi:MAG: DUF1788 domain-containing protein [Prevotellaceae bacterium]|nr:DUF1788 domain-containing protein [Prevotellaceae bacterium]